MPHLFPSHFLAIQMLSLALKYRFGLQIIQRAGKYSASRFFATKQDAKETDNPTNIPSGNEDVKPVETQSRKIDSELPDFPEYPFIREDFVSGIRNRDYLKTLPKEKRIDLLSKKSGDIVYFDDEEFKHYFPHE